MPDDLLGFTGTASDDEAVMDRGIAAWRDWRARRQAWIDAHAPGTTWRDLEAERRRRWPVVTR